MVIGYAGHVQYFQENTLDGMLDLVKIKADGMHMQVQLTRDSQVILYAYDNLEVSSWYSIFEIMDFPSGRGESPNGPKILVPLPNRFLPY